MKEFKKCCKNCKKWNVPEECPYCMRGMYSDEVCQWFEVTAVKVKQ